MKQTKNQKFMYLLLKSSLIILLWLDSKVLHSFLNEFKNFPKESVGPKGGDPT